MALDNFRRIDIRINKANYYIDTQMAKEGDYNGRELVVQITDDGEVKSQAGVSLNLGWRHDSVGNVGLDPFTVVDITKGIFKIAYPKEMLNAGLVTAVIQVVENEKITFTRNFKITVEKNPIDEDAIVSENSFTMLQEALQTLSQYDGKIASLELNKADKTNVVSQSDFSELDDRLTKMGNLTSGKNLKIVSGVIRNNGSDNWQIISDANHQGDLGVASIMTGNYGIDINFNFTAKKIIGFVATPDETYAKELMSVGASVVTNRATINLYQPKPTNQITGRIAYVGGKWTLYNNYGITDVSFGASNDLYINHASCESFIMDITSRNPVLVTFESATATQTKVGFYNPDGTKITTASELMSITFKRDISVVSDTSKPVSAQLNPKLVNNTSGNIWFMGVFEI